MSFLTAGHECKGCGNTPWVEYDDNQPERRYRMICPFDYATAWYRKLTDAWHAWEQQQKDSWQ